MSSIVPFVIYRNVMKGENSAVMSPSGSYGQQSRYKK